MSVTIRPIIENEASKNENSNEYFTPNLENSKPDVAYESVSENEATDMLMKMFPLIYLT